MLKDRPVGDLASQLTISIESNWLSLKNLMIKINIQQKNIFNRVDSCLVTIIKRKSIMTLFFWWEILIEPGQQMSLIEHLKW